MRRPSPMGVGAATVACTNFAAGVWSPDDWTVAPRAKGSTRGPPPANRRPMSETLPTLHGIPDIRAYFRTNQTPVYFVSPTAFNLLGIDRWLRNFFYITYFDSFEGSHPRVRPARAAVPRVRVDGGHLQLPPRPQGGARPHRARRPGGKAVFVMFDDETEAAARCGLEVVLPVRRAAPPAGLQDRHDAARQRGRRAERAEHARPRRLLRRAGGAAESAGLGDDLVVQTPYGDSGKTTFFIRGERDWDRHAKDIVGQEIKVMRRLNVRAAAVEAALTRHGTIVGPLMTDVIGHPELTPHKGGWCGNDIFPDALSPEHLEQRAR